MLNLGLKIRPISLRQPIEGIILEKSLFHKKCLPQNAFKKKLPQIFGIPDFQNFLNPFSIWIVCRQKLF